MEVQKVITSFYMVVDNIKCGDYCLLETILESVQVYQIEIASLGGSEKNNMLKVKRVCIKCQVVFT